MKLSLLSICFIILLSFNIDGQTPTAALETPEIALLYRGYENKIIPAVTNSNGRKILLTGQGVTITKNENVDYYIVKTNNRDRNVSISVHLVGENDTIFIKQVNYRVSNLPDPYIYWGATRQGGDANIRANKIHVKYPPEIPLKTTYKILNWEVNVNAISIKGVGNDISAAEDLFKAITSPSTVTITMVIQGSDGISRKREATWNVNGWDITSEPNEMEYN